VRKNQITNNSRFSKLKQTFEVFLLLLIFVKCSFLVINPIVWNNTSFYLHPTIETNLNCSSELMKNLVRGSNWYLYTLYTFIIYEKFLIFIAHIYNMYMTGMIDSAHEHAQKFIPKIYNNSGEFKSIELL
jgi:hypothetical protein